MPRTNLGCLHFCHLYSSKLNSNKLCSESLPTPWYHCITIDAVHRTGRSQWRCGRHYILLVMFPEFFTHNYKDGETLERCIFRDLSVFWLYSSLTSGGSALIIQQSHYNYNICSQFLFIFLIMFYFFTMDTKLLLFLSSSILVQNTLILHLQAIYQTEIPNLIIIIETWQWSTYPKIRT